MPPSLPLLPQLIGHRGARAHAPENTLCGLEEARRQGARWVEIDVQLTADGVPVLAHDEDLSRCCGRPERLEALDAATLATVDATQGWNGAFPPEPPPRLAAVLDRCLAYDIGLNIELKLHRPQQGPPLVAAVAKAVAAHWPSGRPGLLLSSFDHDALAAAAQAMPELPRGALFEAPLPADWRRCLALCSPSALHLNARSLSPARIAALRAACGLPLLAYTVNDPRQAARLLEGGLTAVFTDRPAALAARLGRGALRPRRAL